MHQNIKLLYGAKLLATDGDIGHVKDFYFDDATWVVRYLVVDTGAWLPGRLVLLTPHVLGFFDEVGHTLHVNLSKQRIEHSPSIESHKPVSRQYEVAYYRYYGWPAYWEGGAIWGMGGFPVVLPPSSDELASLRKLRHRDDKHLQSTQSVVGYHIQTPDGPIGHVTGFLVDAQSWSIIDLVIEAGHWYAGKEILLASAEVERISYQESTVYVNLSKATIQHTVRDHHAKARART